MSEKEKETGEIEERDGFIAIPDGSLYYKKYDIQGKVGLRVVLLHGNRGTHRDFSSYIEVLTKAGCSVIAMDSRGHGASVMKMAALKAAVLKTGRSQEKGKRRWTGAADMAEDVVRLLDHLKIEKAVILGFSDGANTALEFAADHPERAEKIIAVSANAVAITSCTFFTGSLETTFAPAIPPIMEAMISTIKVNASTSTMVRKIKPSNMTGIVFATFNVPGTLLSSFTR